MRIPAQCATAFDFRSLRRQIIRSMHSRVSILVFVILIIAAAMAWTYAEVAPPDLVHSVTFRIPEGATAESAGKILQDAQAIASGRVFAWSVRFLGTPIQPGRYVFTRPVTPWTAARLLAKGPPPEPEVTVTIPEGKRLPEIAAILEAAGVCRAEDFLTAVRSPAMIREMTGRDAPSIEGYLFPDTYKFRPCTEVSLVIRRLRARLQEVLDAIPRPALETHEWITLASIVEREAAVDVERPRIAAVFLNRLRIGMPLAADPTIRFALNKWDTEPVLYEDLKVESPWNTYVVKGLPPGPIAAPGRASLEAVSSPAMTQELFFVARGDGSHLFAIRYEDHLANINAVRP